MRAFMVFILSLFLFFSFAIPNQNLAEEKIKFWTCAMHPQIKLPKPGRCPICGMNLIPVKEKEKKIEEKIKFWTCAMHPQIRLSKPGKCPICAMDLIPVKEEKTKEKIKFWTCAMHPQIQLLKPGRCPICGMNLIPVKEKKVKKEWKLTLSDTAQKLAEVELSRVERKKVYVKLRMYGRLDFDERKVAYITSWIPGRIDKLYVNFTGAKVKKGQPLLYLYSPELLSAQSELIQAYKAYKELKNKGSRYLRMLTYKTIESAKEKLRLWGITESQINEILKRGTPSDHMTIYAPISGTVIQKNAYEGMYVKEGTRLFTIADLSNLWLKMDVYEPDIQWIKVGDSVVFETEAYPGEKFKGTVSFIDPFVDKKTRTVKVRADLPNPEGKLLPNMFGHVIFYSPLRIKPLPIVIPASAPLITGKRAVVYVGDPKRPGVYEGREIELGPRVGDYYIVKAGLKEGEYVVTKGNFKIDSTLQIMAKPSMMSLSEKVHSKMMHHGMGK